MENTDPHFLQSDWRIQKLTYYRVGRLYVYVGMVPDTPISLKVHYSQTWQF